MKIQAFIQEYLIIKTRCKNKVNTTISTNKEFGIICAGTKNFTRMNKITSQDIIKKEV